MTPEQTGESYNKIAQWWVEAQMRNPGYGMKYIETAAGYAKEKSRVLDIGCGGTGRTIDFFLRKNFNVMGIDASSEMIRLAKLKHPDVPFINADFISWESDETFDLIIAWDSIFHAPRELQGKAIKKMCSKLNEKGILIFTSGAYASEVDGKMNGVLFEYGSIGYRKYLDIINEMNCKIILMEEDQYPDGHMIYICQKTG